MIDLIIDYALYNFCSFGKLLYLFPGDFLGAPGDFLGPPKDLLGPP